MGKDDGFFEDEVVDAGRAAGCCETDARNEWGKIGDPC